MGLKPAGFKHASGLTIAFMVMLLVLVLSACIPPPIVPSFQEEQIPKEEIQKNISEPVEIPIVVNEPSPIPQEIPKSSQLNIVNQNFNTTVIQYLRGDDVEERFVEVAKQFAQIAKQNPQSEEGAYAAEQIAFIQSAYLRDFGGALQVYEKILDTHRGFVDDAKIRRQIQSFNDMQSADSFYISNQNQTVYLKESVQKYKTMYERYRNESYLIVPPMALFTAAKITRVDLDDAITAKMLFEKFIAEYDTPDFLYLAREIDYAYATTDQTEQPAES